MDNIFDNPIEWLREETMSDMRFDGSTLADAIKVATAVFRDACANYQRELSHHQPRAAATLEHGIVITEVAQVDMRGMSRAGPAQPAVLAVANGPDWVALLVLSANVIEVVTPAL